MATRLAIIASGRPLCVSRPRATTTDRNFASAAVSKFAASPSLNLSVAERGAGRARVETGRQPRSKNLTTARECSIKRWLGGSWLMSERRFGFSSPHLTSSLFMQDLTREFVLIKLSLKRGFLGIPPRGFAIFLSVDLLLADGNIAANGNVSLML